MKAPLVILLMVLAWSPASYAKKGWRRADGGPALSVGAELAITHVRLTGKEAFGGSDDITGASTMVSLLTIYQADYNFTRDIGLGLRAGGGRVLNSDGFSVHAMAGPTLTLYLGELFYLGVDAFVQMLRFENVSTHGGGDDAEELSELDADFTLGFNFGVRAGLVFEIKSVVTIVPELRLGVQPATFVFDDAFYSSRDGGRNVVGDRMLAAGGGLGIAARFFF